MIEGSLNRSPSVVLLKKFANSVLIRSHEGDDAIYYHAPLGPQIGADAFVIYFHENSRLLERVRLLGSIMVHAEFMPDSSFVGELKKLGETYEIAKPERPALLLQLHERALVKPDLEQAICPIT